MEWKTQAENIAFTTIEEFELYCKEFTIRDKAPIAVVSKSIKCDTGYCCTILVVLNTTIIDKYFICWDDIFNEVRYHYSVHALVNV